MSDQAFDDVSVSNGTFSVGDPDFVYQRLGLIELRTIKKLTLLLLLYFWSR